MATNKGQLCRDLIGCNLMIKNKKVIDEKRNVRARNVFASKSVNADVGNFEALNVEGPLLTELGVNDPKYGPNTIYVGETRKYKTLSEVLDKFQGKTIGKTTIKLDKGTYTDTVKIQGFRSEANLQSRTRDLLDQLNSVTTNGLQIIGDDREVFPHYVNGYQNPCGSSQGRTVVVETDQAGVGPFFGLLAGFGPQVSTPLSGMAVCDPLFATTPITNGGALSGNIALIQRGLIGFSTKTQNVQDVGATAALIFNNSPGIVSMGGTTGSITIPAYSISEDDGLALQAALALYPSMQVSITAPAGFYNPPTGTNYSPVTLTQPASNKIVVTVASPPGDLIDPNLARGVSPVLEQPIFDAMFEPGDKIFLTQSDILWPNVLEREIVEIASVSGNMITLTGPASIDLTLPGASIHFVPNVRIQPSIIDDPIMTINTPCSISGINISTNPDLPENAIGYGVWATGVSTLNLYNIICTDEYELAGNGPAIGISDTNCHALDGFRDTGGRNGRLSALGWAWGVYVASNSILDANRVCAFSCKNDFGIFVGSDSILDCGLLDVFGNEGLYQANTRAILVTNKSRLSAAVMRVAGVYGEGVVISESSSCSITDHFDIQRCSIDPTDTVGKAGLSVSLTSTFTAGEPGRYLDDGSFTSNIRSYNAIRDCNDAGDPGYALGPPALGSASNRCSFFKELQFSGNDLDTITYLDNNIVTPKNSNTPSNVLSVTASGNLDANYVCQTLDGSAIALDLDLDKEYLLQGLYFDKHSNAGKSYNLISCNPSAHTLTLAGSATFKGVGATGTENVATFSGTIGDTMSFKIVGNTSALVTSASGVTFS